jgi:anti-sigma factor RsiW
MTACDDVRTALLSRRVPDAALAAHLAACPRCADEREALRRIGEALAIDAPPAVPAGLAVRVRHAAEPLLERNARRAAWPALARALGAALLPLPAILFVDFHALRAAYTMLSSVLPGGLGLYVVFNHAATLTLLLALAYSAIPILAERQVRLRRRESHG